MADARFQQILTDKSAMTFMGASCIKDRFVKSHFTRGKNNDERTKGTFPCNQCDFCQFFLTDVLILPVVISFILVKPRDNLRLK